MGREVFGVGAAALAVFPRIVFQMMLNGCDG
jgi:hypothetical protein